MKRTGNTIFIPGATSGIGLGLAQRFTDEGNTVIVGGRRADRLERIAADHPNIDTVVIDTTDPTSIEQAASAVIAGHPDLDVLIPMAGIMLPEDLHDPAFLETAESTIATNLLGPIRLLAAFLPQLMSQPDAAVVLVSSGLAFVPLSLTPTYCATKAGIHSFAESMRVQLSDTSVRVIELIPPAVRTALMNQENMDRAMPLDEFLDEVMSLFAAGPTSDEVLVGAVKPLRFAEREGRYDAMLTALSEH